MTAPHPTQADVALGSARAGAPPDDLNWDQINWRQVEVNVRRLQVRIVKATQDGRWNRVL